jgi:glycosyl-4,4'-diaponeurosporenoate acyltransferase
MRLIHLSTSWTIIVDFIAWFIIHMGVVYLFIRVPSHHLDPHGWLFRSRRWEREGNIYQKAFKIKTWKPYLPDGAPFLGNRGFPKKRLQEKCQTYLRSFYSETCRAELIHWIIILFAPLFFIWNPFWVGIFMIFYALIENIPLIMAQRYNRSRLKRVLKDRTHS